MESPLIINKQGEYLPIPISTVNQTLQDMEEAIKNNYQWVGWQADYSEHKKLFYIQHHETAKDFCWSPYPGNGETAILLAPLYQNLKDSLLPYIVEDPVVENIHIPISGIEKANGKDSQMARDYNQIMETLNDMDVLYGDIHKALKDQIFDRADVITLPQELYYNFADDVVQATFTFERDQTGSFALNTIDLKGIFIEPAIINGVNTRELETTLKSILDRDYLDGVGETSYKSIDREIDLAYSLLRQDEKGKAVAETLQAKYEYTYQEDRSKFETRHHFLTFPGLTLDHALNLFLGHDVHMNIPGDEKARKAWFRLDPVQKDKDGNALLLQYGEEHNFDITRTLQTLPLAASKHSIMSMENLEKGYGTQADVLINDKRQRVELVANPANGNFKILSLDKEDRGKELLVMPDSLPDKSFSFAYDSQLAAIPYSQQLHAEVPSINHPKDKIQRWMDEDNALNNSLGRKL